LSLIGDRTRYSFCPNGFSPGLNSDDLQSGDTIDLWIDVKEVGTDNAAVYALTAVVDGRQVLYQTPIYSHPTDFVPQQRNNAAASTATGVFLLVVIPLIYRMSRRPKIRSYPTRVVIRDAGAVRNAWILFLGCVIYLPLVTLLNLLWWAVAAVIGPLTLLGLVRSLRLSVSLDQAAVTVRNFVLSHHLSWSQISEIRFVSSPGFQVRGRGGGFYGAVFRTVDKRSIDAAATYGYLKPRASVLQELHRWAHLHDVPLSADPGVLDTAELQRLGIRSEHGHNM
jgi:hypothetical protein